MITLKNKTFEATFWPEQGMNLTSFKKGEIEVIDQTAKAGFIGPHFGHRHSSALPELTHDPFPFGIGRYAPWKAEASETSLKAVLSGKEEWNGKALSAWQGQNFKMEYSAQLTPKGLNLTLSVVSDADSLVGIHFFYTLPENKGSVLSDIKPDYYENGFLRRIPEDWSSNPEGITRLDLQQSYDCAFRPLLQPLKGKIVLETAQYSLTTRYHSQSEENSWHLYHPSDAQYVCINPISSQNPWRPNLTVSSIQVELEIGF